MVSKINLGVIANLTGANSGHDSILSNRKKQVVNTVIKDKNKHSSRQKGDVFNSTMMQIRGQKHF